MYTFTSVALFAAFAAQAEAFWGTAHLLSKYPGKLD